MLLLFENCQMYLPLRVSKLFTFLTENSNTIIITALAQNCDGLDSDQSFVSQSVLDNVTAWLRRVKCQVNAFFSLHKLYIARLLIVLSSITQYYE